MTPAHTSRKLVERLRLDLDLAAVKVALDREEITPRQAASIAKWIAGVKDIRENPIYAVANDAGRFIGEVVTKNKGASWIGRRYGKNYPSDAAEFSDQAQAVAFVRGEPAENVNHV